MTLEITQEDIDGGLQKSTSDCAIARAIKRTLGLSSISSDSLVPRISVGAFSIKVGNDYYATPKIAYNFIESFDKDKSIVSPFSFDLEKIESTFINPFDFSFLLVNQMTYQKVTLASSKGINTLYHE